MHNRKRILVGLLEQLVALKKNEELRGEYYIALRKLIMDLFEDTYFNERYDIEFVEENLVNEWNCFYKIIRQDFKYEDDLFQFVNGIR